MSGSTEPSEGPSRPSPEQMNALALLLNSMLAETFGEPKHIQPVSLSISHDRLDAEFVVGRLSQLVGTPRFPIPAAKEPELAPSAGEFFELCCDLQLKLQSGELDIADVLAELQEINEEAWRQRAATWTERKRRSQRLAMSGPPATSELVVMGDARLN